MREQYSVIAGLIGIICNFLLFSGKFLVGFTAGSIAIISDAFNNLSDMGSSVISILSAKLSNRPPDEDHPLVTADLNIYRLLLFPSSSFS